MSFTDPIADLLTRMRNALMVRHTTVRAPWSHLKEGVLSALQREGYIRGYEVIEDGPRKDILIYLKYSEAGLSVMNSLKRVSKPGCRRYMRLRELKPILNGIGIGILSTSKGVLSDRECRQQKISGEVVCEIW